MTALLTIVRALCAYLQTVKEKSRNTAFVETLSMEHGGQGAGWGGGEGCELPTESPMHVLPVSTPSLVVYASLVVSSFSIAKFYAMV